MTENILIAGATGVVGFAATKHFAERGDCELTAVSRRRRFETFGARHLAVDLTDAKACADLCEHLGGVSRLVYAAVYEKPGLVPGWLDEDQIRTNPRMFENLLGPLERTSPGLRHVTLLQGTKAYGAHVRRIPIPARENHSELRDVPNFYWAQESHLRERQEGKDWHWSILRPQVIFGLSIGAAMNLIPAIGVARRSPRPVSDSRLDLFLPWSTP
jgi:nucleoside-diphosphate-sugar epimerase